MDLWTYNNYQDYCFGFPCEHSETQAPKISRFTNWTKTTPMAILEFFLVPWTFLHYFLNKGGNICTTGEFGQFAEFSWKYLFKVPQATLTQETKKVWTLQPKPSQRSSLRSSTGKVQECSLTQWLHNTHQLHLCSTAAAEEQHRGAAGSSRGGWGASLWYATHIHCITQ